MEDKVRKFYDTVSQDYEMPDYDTFLANMQDRAKAQKFYNVVSQDYDMPEFNEFYGLFKKKRFSASIRELLGNEGSLEKESTLQSYSQETPITEKDWVGDIAVGAVKPAEQESTSTSQQNLLNAEKTPYFTVENIDEGVDSRLKSETERYAQTLKESPKPVRSQMTWKAHERSKVREYNATLADISESIQQNDVQHYLNVVKSPMLKSLTEKTTEIEEERMSNAVKNKIKRATKLRNELKTSNIVDSDELTWIDNNPLNIIDEYFPDSDLGEGVVGDALRTGKKAYKRWTQFGTSAVNNSLWGLGFLAMGETGKDLLALGQDIQANYNPSKLEEYASIGVGFAFDTPIFMALGGVGGLGAKAFTRAALRATTREMMQLGLTAEVSQGIALKSLSGAAQLAIKGTAGAISGGTVLSTYNAVNDAVTQYKEAYALGDDLEHYDWRRTLESWGEGLLIGTATGFVSPMFSSAGEALSSGLERQAAKKAVSGAMLGLNFATESTLFAAIPAALEGRAITQDDIVESGLMLLAIKGGSLPLKMVGRINVSKTKGKPIEYTDREKELLGVTTDPYNDIKNMSVEDLKKIEADRNIPTLTKLKIMENHSGIAPKGEISIDAIRVEQEGDRTFLRTYRKEKEGSKYEYELLSENEYADKSLADAEAKKGLDMLYDLEIRKAMQELPVRQQGLAASRIVEVLGADSKKLKDVLDIPVFARNEEQRAIAQKFYEVANEITGLGKNAYESKMLDDSFGTEKLHLKERKISPKTEEVIQTTTEGEKVAEMPTVEEKKADIERRRQEEIDNLFSQTQASTDKQLNTPVQKLSKEEINRNIETAKQQNKDLIEELENPEFLNDEKRNDEWNKKADELSYKLPQGVSFRITDGKVDFFDNQSYREKGFGKKIVQVSGSNLHRQTEKFEVGDNLQVQDGVRAIPAIVTKVNEHGKILEAKDEDGKIIISRGNIITLAPINARLKINAKYDAELAKLEQSKGQKAEMPTTEAKKEQNIFELRENFLTLQKEQYGKEGYKQEQGTTPTGEAGGLDVRGKDIAVDTRAERYVVGGSDRVAGYDTVNEYSISDAEANEIKGVRPNFVFDDSFIETKSNEEFHSAISKSKEGNKYAASVFVYPKEDYAKSRLFVTKDGKAGLAVTEEGDIISVFSHGEGKGRAPQLIINAIREGGITLDHYDTALTDYYFQFGFVPVARVKWNDEFAPEDWDKETFKKWNGGQPDVIAMAYHGGDPNTLHERVGKFGSIKELLDKTPYVESWEEAKKLQREYANKVKSQTNAVEEGKVQEGSVGEYQNVDEGRQKTETGHGDSTKSGMEVEEKIQKEEVNEEKGQREGLQVRTWAYEIDDVAEMSIDIESMGREAAKEKVQEYKAKVDNVRKTMQDIITQNRSTLDKISPEYTKHLLRQVANAKPTNLKNIAQRIESIISNAQTQSKLEKAFKQRKKIKEALRNNPEYASFVRSLNVKAKAKDGGKNLAVEFNKVKVESLPEGLVEDYINVVDNLTSKTPNAGMVEDFMKRYSTEIKREAEKASIPNFDPLKTAESLSKQAQELVEGVDMAQATPEAIMSLKRRLSRLLNHAEYLRKQGVMEMTEEDLKEFSQAEDGIKNYIENIIPKVSEEVKGKIEKLEREYKKTAIDNITGRIGNISLLDALDAEKASKVSAILGKLANDDVSLSRLSLNDLEKLSASLDIMEETGVSPVVLNEVYTKARGIDRARKARGSVFEAIKEKIATRDHVKKLFAKGEDSVQRRMAGKPDWATSALFDIGKRVAGMYSNPIYNDITHVGSEAINTSEKFIKAQVTPIYSVFNKDRQNVFERYVYDYGVNRKEMKPFDKVGILMAQVRVANLMKNYRGRVVARGGMFYTVDVEGNPYRVDGKIKVFKTAEEALDFVKSQPIDKLSNGRELDFFDIVNYDYKEGERVYSSKRKDAKLSNDDKQNEMEKKFFEEAYDELVEKNGGKLNNIRTEEDAKKLLTPEEIKYWDTIRDVHASTESMAGEVAANEGLVLSGEDFYFPMNSKNMSDRAYDQSATLEDIYSQAVQGKSLRVTDNILKKTQRMNYIDFNALRATEKYVRDMSMSYHVLPAMREQVDALNYLVKEYKESDPELASFAKALRRNIVDGYRIEYTRSSMWGNQKLWIRNSSVDVSKMAKALSNAARNLALNKLERFPLDFFPNSIKMGTAAFKPVDKAAWNQFYQYNPGVAGAKGVAEMQYGRNVIGDYNEIASKGVLQEFSDNWIEKGDRVSRQHTWANKFPEVYKKISGKEFDLEKYNSDVNYRNSVNNSEEFEQAKAITDSYIDETLVPTNKYSNRKQMNSLLWTLSSKSRAYNFLNAMSSYTANENAQGFVYFNEAKYNRLGNQGTQNVARMGRLLISNMAFQVLSQLGYNTSLYLAGLGSDDEKLKEIAGEGFRGTFDTTNLYANGFMSILSVMMGGYMNLGRYMMSLMYNGAKSGIAYSGDDKWRNKVQKYTKSIEQSMGASRVIDPNIDVTKDYTKTEALLNIIVPFYGKKGLEIIKSGVEIPKQGYNYFSMKFAEDQWMKDPYESGEMIRALNVTIGSLINPAVSSMDVGIRNAIKEEFVNRVPADLVDEIIYMDDFELTYKDARQRLSDKYDQVYKYLDKKNKVGGFSIDLYGNKIINEYSAIGSIKDPETFASEKAGKAFSEYLDKGENRKLYDFYDINKDQIDELIATTRAIIKDKKMGKEEREAKYDIIRKEVENLKYAYGQFKKGEMKGSVYITGKDLMNMNVNDMLRKIERKALKEFRIDEEKLNSIK